MAALFMKLGSTWTGVFSRRVGSKFKGQLLLRTFTKSARCQLGERTDSLDTDLLKILVCPISKQALSYDSDTNELICHAINVAYPVKNGIPNLIPTDGRILTDNNKKGTQSKEGTEV